MTGTITDDDTSVTSQLSINDITVVAALTSVRALLANPGPLVLWALLIVLMVYARARGRAEVR